MIIRKIACPLDCFDVCEAEVQIEEGKVVKIQGSKDNPFTAGFMCKKGRNNIERLGRPDRITTPMLKREGVFEPIPMDEALALIAEKIKQTLQTYGHKGLVHLYDCGYGGVSKSSDELFFNLLGGASTITGGLCWSAGSAATKMDFGEVLGHRFDDCENSKMIILWSRNPAKSNVHFYNQVVKAKAKGARIVVVDPVLTETCKIADLHLRIKPSSDGALALAMGKWIVENHHVSHPELVERISANSNGFDTYKSMVKQFDMDELAAACGLEKQVIEDFARAYVSTSPASIYMGYGLQRYINGGNSVRLVNALAMTAGQIGVAGGGVTYANKRIRRYLDFDGANLADTVTDQRVFINGEFGHFLETASNPGVGFVWVDKANPVNQCPDGNSILRGLEKADFVVTVDLFMTDTAAASDLVLPATGLLEEDDFCYSSMMSPYLLYTEKGLDLPDGMIEEFEIYRRLAEMLNLDFPYNSKLDYFKAVLKPMEEAFGKTVEDLKKVRFELPEEVVPWQEWVFATEDGRFNYLSSDALEAVVESFCTSESTDLASEYPLRLLSAHSGESLNSQGFLGVTELTRVHLNHKTAEHYGLKDGDLVTVTSRVGQIQARLEVNEMAGDDFLLLYQGWWRLSGSANALTEQLNTDIGNQAAYYDTFCRIDKV